MTVDVRIIQKPIYAEFECPHCCGQNTIDYSEFCSDHSECPSDWPYETVVCKECEKELEIDSVDWD